MNEVRLIDANALKEVISTIPYNDYDDLIRTEKLIDNAPSVEPKPISEIHEKALKVVEILTEEHAINVNERRFLQRAILLEPERPQGEWKETDIPESTLCKCSVCNFDLGAYSFNFCPNCGAKMEGGTK